MEDNKLSDVEVVRVDAFEQNTNCGIIGMALMKTRIGLSQHFVSRTVHSDDIDENGNLTQAFKQQTFDVIEFNIVSDVIVCFQELQKLSLVDSECVFTVTNNASFDEIMFVYCRYLRNHEIIEFKNENSDTFIKVKKYSRKLFNVLKETRISPSISWGSREWYLLNICETYLSSWPNISPESAYQIGRLFEQLIWRFEGIEDTAKKGEKAVQSLAKATLSQRPRANERNEAMLNCIIKLWDELKNNLEGTKRINFLKYNNIAAYEIRELAKQKRPPELLVKSSQKVKSERLIRKKISKLKELEKI